MKPSNLVPLDSSRGNEKSDAFWHVSEMGRIKVPTSHKLPMTYTLVDLHFCTLLEKGTFFIYRSI